MLLLLHISDIHFKATEVGQPDDPNRALRSDLLEDVQKMRAEIGQPANGIILTGDIAFAGKAAEFDFAYKWLEEDLCPAAGCRVDEVFVIPGNHDVDRTAEAGPAQQAARAQLRQIPVHKADKEISKWLRDRKSSDVIFGPIENYNRFAAKFVCMLRPYLADDEKEGKKDKDLPGRPFAQRDLDLNDGSKLRMWGFNSVLVCGEDDAKGNMLIDPAASQIQTEAGVTHLVTTHHPFNWLKNGGPFEDRVDRMLDDVTILDALGSEDSDAADDDSADTTPWDATQTPLQVQIVDLLEAFKRPPFSAKPFKIAVVISAWDLTEEVSPDVWLKKRMSLLDQYIHGKDGALDVRLYGVSAQGGRLSKKGASPGPDREKLLSMVPSKRIKVVAKNAREHDLTAPILWLSGLENGA